MKQHDETNMMKQTFCTNNKHRQSAPRIIGRENYERYADMINYQEKVV